MTHHVYNTFKMLGYGDTITIRYDEKDVVRSLEHAYKVATTGHTADEDDVEPAKPALAKKKQLFSQACTDMKKVSLDDSGSGPTFNIGNDLPPGKC